MEFHPGPFFSWGRERHVVIHGGPWRRFRVVRDIVLSSLLVGFLAGCLTDATVDLTKAPFDASTELTDATTGATKKLTDGTSKATTDLTDPTREFLSSTTPGAWFHADGTLNPDHEKIAFVVLNFDNLREDVAHGGGEYLASYATLTGVGPGSRIDFMAFAQDQYEFIFGEGHPRGEALRRFIQTLQPAPFPS